MTWSGGPRKVMAGMALVALITAASGCTGSDSSGSDEAFCARLAETPALSTVIERFTSASSGELDQRLDEAAEAYAALRDAAPGEIDDEVATLVDLVDAVIGAVRSNPDDTVAVADQVRSVIGDHPEADAASIEVTDYAARTCNIELGTTTVPGP